ncbi:MAG: MotA/TolQ/ExbB proton channel family protein [Spirochaetaceae bacterium]|jgi:biopolymer transport protein ExbB|nr:MotA/TolQ/ExbB proton channel family protein [Spirochaetaceae bacterium]
MEDQWSLMQFLEMGGPFMWPLIVFSVATLGLIVERIAYIIFHNLNVGKLKEDLLPMAKQGSVDHAMDYLKKLKGRNPGGLILSELFSRWHLGEKRMERAVEAEAQEIVRRLENGFNFLTALASIAPLTGFLGTVSGMIGAFKSIATATEVNAQLVANGIYEALITTVFGLIIAIFALVGYNLLAHRVDNFTAEITKTVSDITAALTDSGDIE